jgi:hypothetical protein
MDRGRCVDTGRGGDNKMELMEMRHKHQMEMMKLRMEMMSMMRQGKQVPQVIREKVIQAAQAAPATSTAAADKASADVKRLAAELEKLKRSKTMAKEGGATAGSTKTKKELLVGKSSATQQAFMRSSKKPGQNIHWKSWERLKKLIPADFNEAKYLSSNPDVAAAVKQGAMPSGAYHYAMYGMGKGCQAGKDPSGRGKCDKTPRVFKGYNRRPGYLSGIFANWDQAGW